MIVRYFFKLFFDAIFQCFFYVFRSVCLTYGNLNLVENRWFFIVKMQIRLFPIDRILHKFSISFSLIFASFFHYFFNTRLHRFWFDFGPQLGVEIFPKSNLELFFERPKLLRTIFRILKDFSHGIHGFEVPRLREQVQKSIQFRENT